MIPNQPENLLERVRIASPCPMSWDEMKGNEQKRFCQHCNLHVYNLSEMTKREAEELIIKTEGRLCARLYRRADGTVLTKDCPVGLKALRRRLKMRVGVFLSALFGLSLTALGQETKKDVKVCIEKQLNIARKSDTGKKKNSPSTIKGILYDVNDALIPGAKITLTNEKTKLAITTTTDDESAFNFPLLTAGSYTLEVEKAGFKKYKKKNIDIGEREDLSLSLTLLFNTEEVVVGILIDDQPIKSEGGTTIIKGDLIRKLPIPK